MDDASYLSYALTLALDGDFDFSNEPSSVGGLNPNFSTPQHFYGPGLLASPMVFLFSCLDRVSGHPILLNHLDYQNSWSYFGFSFAVHAYFLTGLFLFFRAARRLDPQASPLLAVVICLGCGILYFVLIRPRMSHAFEFFGLGLTTLCSLRLGHERVALRAKAWVFLTALGVFTVISCRPNNVNVLLLPVLISLILRTTGNITPTNEEPDIFKRAWRQACVSAALGLFLVTVMNLAVYKVWFPSLGKLYGYVKPTLPLPNGIEEVHGFIAAYLSLLPKLGHILFGSEFGLLYTNPIIVLGLGALFHALLRPTRRESASRSGAVAILATAYIAYSFSVALIWRWPADSYGWRLLYALFPLGWVGYFLWRSSTVAPSWLRRSVSVAMVLLSLNGLVGTLLFTKSPALSYSFGVNAFGVEANKVDGFNTALLREAFTSKVWDVAIKDGVVGYIRKNLLKSGKSSQAATENPPVTGLWLLSLVTLWAIFLVFMFRHLPLRQALEPKHDRPPRTHTSSSGIE